MSKQFGAGRAEAITDADIARAADMLRCHPADLEAISIAESAGFGWFRDGRIKILPEPHVFYKYLPNNTMRQQARRAGIATRSYKETRSSGHYKRMTNATARYAFWKRQHDFFALAAWQCASIGRYQIMGFNAHYLGFADAEDMFRKFVDSEKWQLIAFVRFLRNKKLDIAIRRGDFNTVEDRYNGGGQGGAYAKVMRTEAAKLRRGKWKNYKTGKYGKPGLPDMTASKADVPTEPAPQPTQKPVSERNGAKAAGGAAVAVGAGLAAFWHNGGWVLVSAVALVVAGYFITRKFRR